MLNIICHQGNANLNNKEMPLYTHYNGQNPEHRHHQMLARWWCQQKLSFIFWWEYKMVQLFCKTVWYFLTKLNVLLIDNAAISLLGIYLKELKTSVPIKTCIRMSVAALFRIAQTWKQPRHPSIGE